MILSTERLVLRLAVLDSAAGLAATSGPTAAIQSADKPCFVNRQPEVTQ